MIRVGALSFGALAIALGTAPMQCSRNVSEQTHEQAPGDAIYQLAEDFRAKGNEQAWLDSLRFLVAKYPSNRHVPAARAELQERAMLRDAGK